MKCEGVLVGRFDGFLEREALGRRGVLHVGEVVWRMDERVDPGDCRVGVLKNRVRVNVLGELAEALVSTPEGRVKFYSLVIVLVGFFLADLFFTYFAEQIEPCSAVGHVLFDFHHVVPLERLLIKKRLFSVDYAVQLEARECEFVSVCGAGSVFQHFERFVRLSLAYAPSRVR